MTSSEIRTADNSLTPQARERWNSDVATRKEMLPGIFTHRGGFNALGEVDENTRYFMKGAFAPEATQYDLGGLSPFMTYPEIRALMLRFKNLREIVAKDALNTINHTQQDFEDQLRQLRGDIRSEDVISVADSVQKVLDDFENPAAEDWQEVPHKDYVAWHKQCREDVLKRAEELCAVIEPISYETYNIFNRALLVNRANTFSRILEQLLKGLPQYGAMFSYDKTLSTTISGYLRQLQQAESLIELTQVDPNVEYPGFGGKDEARERRDLTASALIALLNDMPRRIQEEFIPRVRADIES